MLLPGMGSKEEAGVVRIELIIVWIDSNPDSYSSKLQKYREVDIALLVKQTLNLLDSAKRATS